jgi:hypothetical protein
VAVRFLFSQMMFLNVNDRSKCLNWSDVFCGTNSTLLKKIKTVDGIKRVLCEGKVKVKLSLVLN